jgi:hypothetical protein
MIMIMIMIMIMTKAANIRPSAHDANAISVNMDMTELLRLMEFIATALITGLYITDFTIHDVRFIHETNAGVPFVWLVHETGTHLYSTDNIRDVRHFREMLDHYENYSEREFCLYRYDGNKLFPVFPRITRILIESELTKE